MWCEGGEAHLVVKREERMCNLNVERWISGNIMKGNEYNLNFLIWNSLTKKLLSLDFKWTVSKKILSQTQLNWCFKVIMETKWQAMQMKYKNHTPFIKFDKHTWKPSPQFSHHFDRKKGYSCCPFVKASWDLQIIVEHFYFLVNRNLEKEENCSSHTSPPGL